MRGIVLVPLSAAQKKKLRAIAHSLRPVVTIARKGLTDAVSRELERALNDHELIKIKLAVEDRQLRRQFARSVCDDHRAELIQVIGKVLVVYRLNPTMDPRNSNVQRGV